MKIVDNFDWHVLDEIPFSSDKKYRAVLLGKANGIKMLLVSGAPEIILNQCTSSDKNEIEFNKHDTLKKVSQLSQQGLRVIAFAYKLIDPAIIEINHEALNALEFIGLIGMKDPVRPEAKEAIKLARQAGIRTIMVTGDHLDTALSIAAECGILTSAEMSVRDTKLGYSQTDLDLMSESQFTEAILNCNVFARLDPKTKFKITDLLQKNGHIVAMTGDGVNDAPALKKADVGIAMGKNGTDVAREASQMVLADDNFATIINAIAEGRKVFENVRKATYFLLSTNFAEVVTVMCSIIIGIPLPLTATQILWLNLVTDGVNGIAISLDGYESDIMSKAPKNRNEPILNKGVIPYLLVMIAVMAPLTLLTFYTMLPSGIEKARSAAFTLMALSQLFNLPNLRSIQHTVLNNKIFDNKYLNFSFVISFLLVIIIPQIPLAANYLQLVPLSFLEFLIISILSSMVIWIMEIYKFIVKLM